jgi:SPP1 gp7 family putative phage head morphogenesis protein
MERAYTRFVRSYTQALAATVREKLVPRLSRIHSNFNDSEWITDAFHDEIKELLKQIEEDFLDYAPEPEPFLGKLANEISLFNLTQHVKQVKWAFGIDLFAIETWAKDATESWVSENVSLIKSIPNSFFRELEANIVREIRAGTRVENIAKMIADRTGVTRSRGLLIARDQVGKFNGQLSKRRQEDAGIKRYIWRTVGDERVRPSHRANNGKTFSWSDPPKGTGHVGQDIQCRCYAEPIFTDVE